MRRHLIKIYKLRISHLLCFILLLYGIGNTAAAQERCADGAHQYEVTVLQNASEEADGERAYTCTICGDYYIEVIPATGHIWGDWIVGKEATCLEDGYRYRDCIKYPNETHRQEEVIPATGHSYVRQVTAATCENDGEVRYECTACHDVYTEAIPATGHSWGDWIVEQAATKQEDGYRYRLCLNDSAHIQEETLAKLVHEAEPETKPSEEREAVAETEPETEAEPGQKPAASLNIMDMILCSVILGSIICFARMIYHDYIVILWHKRKIREYLSKIEK